MSTSSEGPLLELREVTKSFPGMEAGTTLEILRGVDLVVPRAQRVAILGPSGSGKSTLLQIMGALSPVTSGDVRLDGTSLPALNVEELARLRNEQIGFVFQFHHLLPQCTALENVVIPTLARRDGAGRREAQQRAASLLERVGLADRMTHRPGFLSGGECQRVAVVRALINSPKLILADEPTGSLDAANAASLTDVLCQINEEEGVTFLAVTHSLRLAEQMHRVLELRDGVLGAGEATVTP